MTLLPQMCRHCAADRHDTCLAASEECECNSGHFGCEACGETLMEGDKSVCTHATVCDACVDVYCRDCANADRFYELVDRAYAESKEGWM